MINVDTTRAPARKTRRKPNNAPVYIGLSIGAMAIGGIALAVLGGSRLNATGGGSGVASSAPHVKAAEDYVRRKSGDGFRLTKSSSSRWIAYDRPDANTGRKGHWVVSGEFSEPNPLYGGQRTKQTFDVHLWKSDYDGQWWYQQLKINGHAMEVGGVPLH